MTAAGNAGRDLVTDGDERKQARSGGHGPDERRGNLLASRAADAPVRTQQWRSRDVLIRLQGVVRTESWYLLHGVRVERSPAQDGTGALQASLDSSGSYNPKTCKPDD